VPCAKSVPHLNELRERYEAKGLSIIGVTSESASETEPWIQDKGVQYAYAYDKGGKVARYFGVGGIPHAVLIDAGGKVVWDGHPGALDDETIESSLRGALAKPLYEWPAAAKPIVQSLAKGDFAGAVAKSAKLGDAEIAQQVQAILEGRVKSAEAALAEGNFFGARESAERLVTGLAGLPEQARAKQVVADVDAHPDAKRVLDGQKAIRKLQAKELSKRKDLEKAMEDLKKISTDLRGTYAGKEAEAFMEQVRLRLQK
jgi:thioredoxin-like negative regulator of GroEL